MVEVDPQTPLIGADGPVPLIDIFDGRSQLIAYFQMWHTGRPAAEQCEGCTFSTTHINELCLTFRPQRTLRSRRNADLRRAGAVRRRGINVFGLHPGGPHIRQGLDLPPG